MMFIEEGLGGNIFSSNGANPADRVDFGIRHF
jgi:hypothetical protein